MLLLLLVIMRHYNLHNTELTLDNLQINDMLCLLTLDTIQINNMPCLLCLPAYLLMRRCCP